MNLASRFALGAALALAATVPGAAQQAMTLNKNERATILALKTALDTKNYPAAQSAVTAAQSAASSGYARYLASALQLRLGAETNNQGLQSSAIDAMLSSGAAPASELPQLYRSQAALLLDAGKYEKAENSLTRAVEAAPSDADLLLALAEVKLLRKKGTEAVGLMERAVSVRRAAGQPVPQSWLKRGAAVALQNKAIPQAMAFSRELVAAYPTPQNWRDALLVAREITPGDANARVDALRLLRQIKGLAGERDYLDLAQTLSNAGLNIEADSVLDEAVAANLIDPAKASYKELIASTSKKAATERKALAGLEAKAMAAATGTAALSAGDAYLGAGDYAKAATLYQAAIQKGSIDAGIAGTRLGIAQAMAGQKMAAETALRSVNGPRAELSSLWLVWVAQRA